MIWISPHISNFDDLNTIRLRCLPARSSLTYPYENPVVSFKHSTSLDFHNTDTLDSMKRRRTSFGSGRGSIPQQQSLRSTLKRLITVVRGQERTIARLRDVESMFHSVADGSTAAIFVLQGNKFRYVNKAMAAMSGYSEKELVSMNFWNIAHPDYRKFVRRRGLERQHGKGPPAHYEFMIRTKSAKSKWIDFYDGVIEFKGKPATVGTAYDLTHKKDLEQKLLTSRDEVRELASHINYIRQRQVSRLAQEIHDELGPVLTGIKMGAEALSKRIGLKGDGEQSSVLEDINELEHLADRGFIRLRAITSMLKPWVPDIHDLPYALESLAKGFEKQTKISCYVHSQFEVLTLERDPLAAVYMIVQEALTNIARHSGAKKASILLTKQDGKLVVRVKDNGRGITDESKLKYRTLGLLGMKERAEFLGGELHIQGKRNSGTVVELRFPFTVPLKTKSKN